MDFTLRTKFNIFPEYLNENITSGIYFDAIGDAYTIYLNGKLVGREGKVENGKVVLSRYGNRIKYPLNFSYFKEGKMSWYYIFKVIQNLILQDFFGLTGII